MTQAPIIEAKHFFPSQNTLGEGILWDSKTQLLHWVDIDTAEIHTLDPKSMKYGVDKYPETKYVTALALRKDEPGFIGLMSHEIVFFPSPTPPTSTSPKLQPKERKPLEILSAPLPSEPTIKSGTRFNDGGCDPSGRFFAGSMTLPELKDGQKRGQLWRYDPDGSQTLINPAVGTSNGIGWSPDYKIMYYIDSVKDEITKWDYDISTGTPSNMTVFAPTPPALPESGSKGSVFDGLTIDGKGNIWVARWKDERVIGYNPDGEIICHIKVPGCKSPTIPCFGGDNLETMFIATAHSKLANEGDIQDKLPFSGDIFSVDFSEGSEIRKLLGEGWKGAERYRFGG